MDGSSAVLYIVYYKVWKEILIPDVKLGQKRIVVPQTCLSDKMFETHVCEVQLCKNILIPFNIL